MKILETSWAFALLVLIVAGCSDTETITAFKSVNLVTMTQERVMENQTVLVAGDRILDIGHSNKLAIPHKAIVIDSEGAYLMPGLADMHVHLIGEWPLPQLDLYLANGVTSVRDLDGRDFMLQWRDEIKDGDRTGPTIYASSPIIRGFERKPSERILKRKLGYDCIKLYSYFSRDEYKNAMKLAKEHNLYTVGHIPFAVGLDGVIAAGMDEIAHVEELAFELIEFDRKKQLKSEEWFPYLKEVILQQLKESFGLESEDIEKRYRKRVKSIVKKLQKKNIQVCTTLLLDEIIVQKLFELEKFLEHPTSVYLPGEYINSLDNGTEKHQIQFKGGEDFAPIKYVLDRLLLIELKNAGIPLVLGTDAGTGQMGVVPGFSLHDEIRVLTELGFSPYEAITACTRNASQVVEAMTGKNEFGTIEVGKRADFLLVNKNPLLDVANLKDCRGVMAAGRWYDMRELQKRIDPSILPTIPIIAGIMNVRTSENEFETNIDILIGKSFSGRLPDDIDEIIVSGPNGVLPVSKDDFSLYARARDLYVSLPGSPAVGTYTFTVISGNRQGRATDTQSVIRPMTVPEDSTFRPAEGQTVTSKSPTFSWGAVEYLDHPVYYLFQLYDSTGREIYRRGRRQNLTSHTVPVGILKPGHTYRWRIRISDSGHWLEEQNRSETKKLTFTMAESLE